MFKFISFPPLAGTGQGLKLILNVESEEYMAGPLAGLGVLVSSSKYKTRV